MEARDLERLSTYVYGRFPVGALSYCWETPEHRDPVGNTLLTLADALENCYQTQQKAESPYHHFSTDTAIFCNFSCLFQHTPGGKRSDEEDQLFKWALENLDLIYTHQLTTVWLLTKSAPPSRPNYYHSGWTTYESLAARILTIVDAELVRPPVFDVGNPLDQMAPAPLAIAKFRDQVKDITLN